MMKPIASTLLVFAAALLCSAPARAGYADGMSQYAGYHVMHGTVDPMGLRFMQLPMPAFEGEGGGGRSHPEMPGRLDARSVTKALKYFENLEKGRYVVLTNSTGQYNCHAFCMNILDQMIWRDNPPEGFEKIPITTLGDLGGWFESIGYIKSDSCKRERCKRKIAVFYGAAKVVLHKDHPGFQQPHFGEDAAAKADRSVKWGIDNVKWDPDGFIIKDVAAGLHSAYEYDGHYEGAVGDESVGGWYSKLGSGPLIWHEKLEQLFGEPYGRPTGGYGDSVTCYERVDNSANLHLPASK